MTDRDEDTGREDDAALAAEYALGLLEPGEARAFEDRMATDPALRAEYAFWAERFAGLAEEVEPVAPPPTTFEAIEARLFPLHRRGRGGIARALWAILGTGGVVAAALIFLTLVGPIGGPARPSPDFRVDVVDAGSFATLGIGATRDGVFHLILDDYEEPPAGTDYEMWLIAGDDPPLSLGVVPRGETGDVWLELPAEVTERFAGGAIAVSREPAGGSPDGTPSEVLAAAEIREL